MQTTISRATTPWHESPKHHLFVTPRTWPKPRTRACRGALAAHCVTFAKSGSGEVSTSGRPMTPPETLPN